MGLLTWICVGLVAGFIAELAVGGGLGGISIERLIVTILLGVGGAILGGFVSSYMGWGDVTGFNVRSLVIATLGAIAVVVVWHAISNQRGNRRGLI
jgi:uncharacterized membrane protein YeaQ/YmgE (transglycosylase-associated protein family)